MGTIDAAIGRGFLSAESFENLLRQNPRLREIELSNYGEIMLNPDLPKILETARNRGVITRADNGVNLNSANDVSLDALVRHRLRSMTCSIDGASDETYQQYRVRGSFTRVLDNIRKINELKDRLRTPFPIMNWQFIAFRHNEHEIETAEQLARELGMKFTLKLSWDPELEAKENASVAKKAGAKSRADFNEKSGDDYMGAICHQLWNGPQVNWDGRMLGCCRNYWGGFGANAFEDGLDAAMNSEKMVYARRMLEGKELPREDIPCASCDIYKTRQKSGHWVTPAGRASHEMGRAIYRSLPFELLTALALRVKRRK